MDEARRSSQNKRWDWHYQTNLIHIRSLDEPLPGGDARLIADTRDARIETIIEHQDDVECIMRRAWLTKRDKLVLRLRFTEGLQMGEIGARLHISEAMVSRILGYIIKRLRT